MCLPSALFRLLFRGLSGDERRKGARCSCGNTASSSPGAGRGHRPPNPAAQGPSWTPRTIPSPAQLIPGPRGCARWPVG
jgi:hypothetical protein